MDPGPAEKVQVVGNIFMNNQPFGIQLFLSGTGNIFTLNLCSTSDPGDDLQEVIPTPVRRWPLVRESGGHRLCASLDRSRLSV